MGGQTEAAPSAPAESAGVPAIDVAAVVAALLAHPDFGKIVVHVGDDLLASDAFGAQLLTRVDQRVADKVPDLSQVKVPSEDDITALVERVVADRMPETDAQRTERLAGEAAERADARTRADRKLAKSERDAADKRATERAKMRTAATGEFAKASDTRGSGDPIDLDTVEEAMLLLDDDAAFDIDFRLPVDTSKLSLADDGAVVMKHDAIDLGAENEPFMVQGIDLALKTSGGVRYLRCPLPSTLAIGGGATARLSPDSLIFRDR